MLRSRKALSALAAFLAVTFAFSPFAAIVHADTHAHRFCAEHLTFEEAAEGVTSWAKDDGRFSYRTTSLPAPDDSSTPHEACTLGPMQLTDCTPAPIGIPLSFLVWWPAVPAAAPLFVAPQRSPLELAPKASPPTLTA